MKTEGPPAPIVTAPDPVLSSAPPFCRTLLRHPMGIAGFLIVGLACLAAVFAGVLPLRSPDKQWSDGLTSRGMPLPPGAHHYLLGTDSLGRDMLSRLVWGSRISLEVGVFAILVALGIGILVGVTAGFLGGWVDVALMRLTDVAMTIPSILLAIALVAIQQRPSEISVLIAVAFSSWTGIARILRGEALRIKEKEFIEAARAIGCGPWTIASAHILPNMLPLIVVLGTIGTAGTILLDAGLSYLGLGVPPPAASWGRMIADGQAYYLSAPWILLEPGVVAAIVVIGFNMLGQALQETLDPYRLT